MKIKLTSILVFLAVLAACGGGGGGGSLFNFFGLWFASFNQVANTCDFSVPRSGNALFDITQNGELISAQSKFFDFQGEVNDDNNFLAVDAQTFFRCPNGEMLTNVTATLEFLGASGDSVDVARLSFFGDCEASDNMIFDQCEVVYEGSAIRISGGGGASGEIMGDDENSTLDSGVDEPLF